MRFINEQNSQELQISHSLRICFFTELRKVTVGAGFLLLLSHTESAQTLRLASEFLTTRRFLPPGCTSWVPGACSCIHTHNQRNLYHWDLNSWRLPDAPFYRAAHRGCRSLAPVFTHRISASLPLGSEFLVVRRFLPLGCTSWVPCACSCIHTQKQRFHTQNQRNLYRWHPNSWRPDASCRWAAHRGCRALAPAFTHRISAISAVGIRIPGGQTLPANSIRRLPGGQTLPAAGLPIVGAVRLLLHSHTQSAQSLRWASEFLAARRFLPPGCPSWVPCACSCIHTQNQRNLYCWHPNSWRPDASCRRADHRGCRALESAFSHTESAQSAQSLLLASLCARASVNLPPAQKDRSLTSATLRFR